MPLQLATDVNEVWNMDFVSDSLSTGRRIKCPTVANDFIHECVRIAVDWGISDQYVTRLLDQAAPPCVFRRIVTARFGIVTGRFGHRDRHLGGL